MKKRLLFLIAFAVATAIILPGIANADMLTNPSLEEDLDANGAPDDWLVWGAYASYWGDGFTAYRENDPLYTAHDGLDCGQTSGTDYAFWFQNVAPIVVGETYYFGFFAKDIDPAGSTVGVSIGTEYWNGTLEARGTRTELLADLQAPFGDGDWHYVETSFTVSTGVGLVTVTAGIPGGGGDYLIDDLYMSTSPQSFHPVHTPVPENGAESVDPSTSSLAWTRDDVMSGGGLPQVELYLAEDPNIFIPANLKMALADADSGSVTLAADKTYYWGCKYQDPAAPAGPLLEGSIWSIDTINRAPEVDAGANQSAWLDGTPEATVTLAGSAPDDGLPTSPGSVSYTWQPTVGASFANTSDPTTTVTFIAAGTYTLTLEASDGSLSPTDTVKVYVYPEATEGLVAWYRFDHSSMPNAFPRDWSPGFVHLGTVVGDATFNGVDQKVGAGCMTLDGDGDYMEIGDSGTADPNFPTWASPLDPTVMTVMAWIKGGPQKNYAGIVHKGSSGDQPVIDDAWQLQISGNSNDVEFKPGNAEGAVAVSGGDGTLGVDTVLDDKWHHVAGVLIGNQVQIYIDAILSGTADWDSSAVTTGGHTFFIGNGSNLDGGEAFEFAGLIDEVRIYEVPLNAEKILAQYIAEGGDPSCGGRYNDEDVNQDCYTNLTDWAIIAAAYGTCNDVSDPGCN